MIDAHAAADWYLPPLQQLLPVQTALAQRVLAQVWPPCNQNCDGDHHSSNTVLKMRHRHCWHCLCLFHEKHHCHLVDSSQYDVDLHRCHKTLSQSSAMRTDNPSNDVRSQNTPSTARCCSKTCLTTHVHYYQLHLAAHAEAQ